MMVFRPVKGQQEVAEVRDVRLAASDQPALSGLLAAVLLLVLLRLHRGGLLEGGCVQQGGGSVDRLAAVLRLGLHLHTAATTVTAAIVNTITSITTVAATAVAVTAATRGGGLQLASVTGQHPVDLSEDLLAASHASDEVTLRLCPQP